MMGRTSKHESTSATRALRNSKPVSSNIFHDACIQGLQVAGVLGCKVELTGLVAACLACPLRGGGGGVEDGAHVLAGAGQEDDLAVGRLGHGLHGLEVTDLHGRCRAENVGGLSHQLGRVNLWERMN